MPLYESFFIAQHVSNVITFILRSRRLYVGVLFCFGVYWYIGAVRLEWGGIRMQVGALRAPEDECNNIRNMLSNKKTFIKWHQVGSIYSTMQYDFAFYMNILNPTGNVTHHV